jgi:hypothetical protein
VIYTLTATIEVVTDTEEEAANLLMRKTQDLADAFNDIILNADGAAIVLPNHGACNDGLGRLSYDVTRKDAEVIKWSERR